MANFGFGTLAQIAAFPAVFAFNAKPSGRASLIRSAAPAILEGGIDRGERRHVDDAPHAGRRLDDMDGPRRA